MTHILDADGWPIVEGARVYGRVHGVRGRVIRVREDERHGRVVDVRTFKNFGLRTVPARNLRVQRGEIQAQETEEAWTGVRRRVRR